MSFVFNRWVRGDDFVGRTVLLRLIRDRNTRPTWILGNRRVGKTSMLRQIEWLCRTGTWESTAALYWDLQGAGDMAGLRESFIEALEDAEELTDDLDLDIDELEDASFNEVMRKFRRAIKGHVSEQFLLLIDECEELVEVAAKDPNVLSMFRKLNHTKGCGLIMAGSMRMMDLDESASRTSPFLPDFLPPTLLGPFEEEECREVLEGNGLDEAAAARIFELTLGNPHLVQVLGEHFQRIGDMDRVLAELERDKICHYFFQSNFQCLPEIMRGWWTDKQAVAQLAAMSSEDTNLPFAVQSSLVTVNEHGISVSPLLEMVEGNSAPRPSPSPKTVSQQARVKKTSLESELFEHFGACETLLSCLTDTCIEDPAQLKQAKNPPSLTMISSMDESEHRLHEILNGASPEYVLGQPADERTSVYLAGLFLYRRYLGCAPFDSVDDPWERAGMIGDRNVPITPQQIREAEMPSKTAMVLVRALDVNPDRRYQTLQAMRDDLI